MQWSNQTLSHLTTHRNLAKQVTDGVFLACPKTPLKWSAATKWYIDMYIPEGTLSRFVFHLVQNVYHMPHPHLVFADSAHSSFLPYPSVKSRAQTQSKISLLHKTGFLFVCLFQKRMFGNTFNILCSLPWIQGPAPENRKPPFPPKSFSAPTRAKGFTGPSVLIGIIQLLSHVWLFVITCMATEQASLSYTILCSFLKLMSIELVMPSHHLIL